MFGQNTQYGQQYGGYNQPQGYGQQYGGGYTQQQPQSQQPAQPLASVDDIMAGGGAKAYFNADSQPGDSVSGVIEHVETLQTRDFQTQQPEYWNDGSPKMQIRIIIQTDLNDPSIEEDDGRRSLYVKAWGLQLKALREACRRAGIKSPKPGDRITQTYTGLGERGNAPQPPKLYAFTIERPSATDALLNPPAQQQHAAPMAQPAAPAPAPVAIPATTPAAPPAAGEQQRQQVLQLKALGRTPQDIAGLLNLPVEQVIALAGTQSAQGSEQAADLF